MRSQLRAIPGFVFVLMFAAFRFSAAADLNSKLLDAAEKGDISTISVLLDAGADADETGGRAFSALHFAALAGNAEAIVALLNAGADPSAEGDFSPTTPLHWAAQMGHVRAIVALLSAGADAYAKDISGRVPLELALACEHTEAESVLLSARTLAAAE